jgi:hypothetical protein
MMLTPGRKWFACAVDAGHVDVDVVARYRSNSPPRRLSRLARSSAVSEHRPLGHGYHRGGICSLSSSTALVMIPALEPINNWQFRPELSLRWDVRSYRPDHRPTQPQA